MTTRVFLSKNLLVMVVNLYKRNFSFIIIILLILISLHPLTVAYNYPYNYLGDDAFITLTYSKNIVNGKGFIFNHPPATLGTTTPLFTITVALFSKLLSVDIRVIAVFLSALCWIGIIWAFFIFRTVWNLRDWQVGIIALVIAGLGWRAWLQMEAYVFAFLLTLSFSLFYKKLYLLSGFTVNLLFLTRGEGVLLLPIFLATTLIQNRVSKRPAKDLAVELSKLLIGFLAPMAIWFFYASYTFGSFLPNTLGAKQVQGLNNIIYTFFHYLTTKWISIWIERYNVLWFMFVIGLFDSFTHNRKRLIWIVWISVYILGYSLLNVAGYDWYRLPIIFVLKVFAGFGLIRAIKELVRMLKIKSLFTIPLIVLTVLSFYTVIRPILHYQPWTGDKPRGESYIKLSQWFNDNTKAFESVAFVEVGYLGYYTNNKIVDLLGLVSPDIIPYIAEGDLSGGFWKYRPDYLVYMAEFDWILGFIIANPQFKLEYLAVMTLPGPWGTDLTIYKRRSSTVHN